jgi:hypothetical protein
MSSNRNDTFDKITLVDGINKNDDVTSFRILQWNQGIPEKRNLDSIDEFVDKDMVSDEKGVPHGFRWYLERLNDKCPDENGE